HSFPTRRSSDLGSEHASPLRRPPTNRPATRRRSGSESCPQTTLPAPLPEVPARRSSRSTAAAARSLREGSSAVRREGQEPVQRSFAFCPHGLDGRQSIVAEEQRIEQPRMSDQADEVVGRVL